MGGHPLHPALVHFPLGLLLSATIADLGQLAGLWAEPRFAALLIAAGLVTGLLAMGAGLADFTRLDEAAVPHALRHMVVMALAWFGYGVTLYLRRDALTGATEIPAASVAASVGSAAALAFGGFLGGELVYRHGAGRIAR